jgi:putative addiction module component (TIGR02574 family)
MTDEQYAEVERRAKDFEAGKTKMLSWEEVKKRIRNKKRRNSK